MSQVSQCRDCKALTMMVKCPKCGGPTVTYHSAQPPPPPHHHNHNERSTTPRQTAGRQRAFTTTTPRPAGTLLEQSPHRSPSRSPHPRHATPNKSGASFSKDLLQSLHDDVELFTSPRGGAINQATTKLPQFRTEEQIATAWAQQHRERDAQSQLLAVREKLQTILLEKDAWVMKDLRQQEAHNEALRIMDDQMGELRRSLTQAQSRLVSLESELTASQRRVFEEEQRAVQAERNTENVTQDMQSAHESNILRIKDLTATIGSLREAMSEQARRQEEAQRQSLESSSQLADLKDELDTLRASRATLNHRTGTLDADNSALREKVASLERQLQLASVEQRAQSDELHVVRDREVPRLTKALSDAQRDLNEVRDALTEERKRSEMNSSSVTERNILQERTAHLQTQLSSTEEELHKSREVSEELRTEVRRLARSNEGLDTEVQHSRQSAELLSKELHTVRDELKQTAEHARQTMEEQHRRFREAAMQLEAQVYALQQQLGEAQERTKRAARDHDAELHAAYASLEEQKGVSSQLRTLLEEQKGTLQALQADAAQRQDHVAPERVAELRSRLEDQLAQYAASSEGHQRSAHQLRLTNDTLRSEVDEQKRLLSASQKREEGLRRLLLDAEIALGLRNPNAVQLLESLSPNSREVQAPSLPPVADLSGTIRSLMRDRNEALEKAERNAAELQRLTVMSQQEQSALRDEGRAFADQLAKAHQQLLEAERESKRLQSTLEGRLAELATEKRCAELREQETKISADAQHQREIDRLTAQVEKAKELHLESEQAALKLRTQLADAQMASQRSEKDYALLQRKLDECVLRERHSTDRIRALEKDLVAAQEREDELQNSLDNAANQQLRTRRDTEAAALALTDALTKEQHEMAVERQGLQQRLETLERERQRQQQLFELEAEVARTAEARCAELEALVSDSRKDRDELFQTVENVKNSSRNAAGALEANVRGLELELVEVREKLLTTQSEVAAVTRQRDALLVENGKISSERLEAMNRLEAHRQQQQAEAAAAAAAVVPPPAASAPLNSAAVGKGFVVGSATVQQSGGGPSFPRQTTVMSELHRERPSAAPFDHQSPVSHGGSVPSHYAPVKADALPVRGGGAHLSQQFVPTSFSPFRGTPPPSAMLSGGGGPLAAPASVSPSVMMMSSTQSADAIRERNDALLLQLRQQRLQLTSSTSS